MLAYEENYRRLKEVAPDVAMLPSNFDWFLPQLAVGADGLLSGLASLTPAWLADLWVAADRFDLRGMRTASDRPHPIVRALYGPSPIIDMHTRIKVGHHAHAIFDCAHPRLPLVPVGRAIENLVPQPAKKRGPAP